MIIPLSHSLFSFYFFFQSLRCPKRAIDVPLRISIIKAEKVSGIGTVAIGKIIMGRLQPGQKLSIEPGGLELEVKTVEIHHTDKKDTLPGDIIGFALKNVRFRDIHRGMVATSIDSTIRPVTEFIAQVIVVNHPGQIRPGYTPFCYAHTASFPCRLLEILKKIDKRTGKTIEENPQFLKRGDAAIVKMAPYNKQVVLEVFTICPPLGRLAFQDARSICMVAVVKSVSHQATSNAHNKPRLGGRGKYFRKQ